MAKTPPFSLCNEFCVGGGGASNAKNIKYDNKVSGLAAKNVNDAIDETYKKIDTAIKNAAGAPYIVSPDKDGKQILIHDLPSGAYVFKGTFNFGGEEVTFDRATSCDVYKHSDRACFLTYLEANPSGVDVVNMQYVWAEGTSPDEVYCETHRYSMSKMKDMENAENKVKNTDGISDKLLDSEEYYPSMLTMKQSIENANNYLVGSKSGEVVVLDDISPVRHTLKLKAARKNWFNNDTSQIKEINYTSQSGAYTRYGYEIALPPGTYTIRAIAKEEFSDVYLYGYVLNKDGKVIGSSVHTVVGNVCQTKTFTINEGERLIQVDSVTADLAHAKQSFAKFDVMLEEGTMATEYTPYVPDVSVGNVITFGRNLFKTEGAELGGVLQDGITNDGNASYITTDYIPVFKGMKGEFNLDGLVWEGCFAYDEGKNCIESIDIGTILNTDDTAPEEDFPQGTRYIRFVLAKEGYSEFTPKEVKDFKNSKCQLVLGQANAQTYEPYNGFMSYPITSDGTVEGVTSIYPTMTITTDTKGVVVKPEYHRDINKAFAELQQAIISLGGNI